MRRSVGLPSAFQITTRLPPIRCIWKSHSHQLTSFRLIFSSQAPPSLCFLRASFDLELHPWPCLFDRHAVCPARYACLARGVSSRAATSSFSFPCDPLAASLLSLPFQLFTSCFIGSCGRRPHPSLRSNPFRLVLPEWTFSI